VKLLLDTHVVLWWRADSTQLTRAARRTIASAAEILVSAASGWEVAVKVSVGKLRLADSFAWMVSESGFTELSVNLAHAERVTMLPRHHRDPFDRMLVAQAQAESATLVTHDRRFTPYDVPVIWV
jgi:PIN domain nuclease of toxin-antitoxin system